MPVLAGAPSLAVAVEPGSPARPLSDWATRFRTACAPPTASSGTLTAAAINTTTTAAMTLGSRRILPSPASQTVTFPQADPASVATACGNAVIGGDSVP